MRLQSVFFKLFSITAVLTACMAVSASAGQIGVVRDTDIVAFLDESPIASYNYQDYTYVIAEDLRNYGFTVEWDGQARTLSIDRAAGAFGLYAPAELLNEPAKAATFQPVFPVYETDIITYVNGRKVAACNIDGRTLINTEELNVYGVSVYDNSTRTLKLSFVEPAVAGMEKRENEFGWEQGVFEGDTLAYGVSYQKITDRFGDRIDKKVGDFKNNRYVQLRQDYREPADRYSYVDGEASTQVQQSKAFRFGRYVTEAAAGGSRAYYLPDGGLYLTAEQQAYSAPFQGTLYAGGAAFYTGLIQAQTMQEGDLAGPVILRALNYTAADGVIYYGDAAAVYYKGNVVNGLAHGTGKAYQKPTGFSGQSYKIYEVQSVTTRRIAEPDLLYSGGFADGLYDGEGEQYFYGMLQYDGTWNYGVKEGYFTEYEIVSIDAASPSMMLAFEGTYQGGAKEGAGTDYDPLGIVTYSGVYPAFSGTFENGNWKQGKWYIVGYHAVENENYYYLYYDGAFGAIGEKVYGTLYNEDGTVAARGYFIDWKLQP